MSLDSSIDDEEPEPLPPLLSSSLLQDAKENIVAATKNSTVSFLICFTIAKSFDEYNLYVFELGNFCHFVN